MTAGDADHGRLVVVIDDDPAILDGMRALFANWGYTVVAGASEEAALTGLAQHARRPDLIVCDERLAEGRSGIQAIERVRRAFEIPALLIAGDDAASNTHEVRAGLCQLLQKPVDVKVLQSTMQQTLERTAPCLPIVIAGTGRAVIPPARS